MNNSGAAVEAAADPAPKTGGDGFVAKQPPKMKSSVVKSTIGIVDGASGAMSSVRFSSASLQSSPTKSDGGDRSSGAPNSPSANSSSAQLARFKLERGRIARRELAEMDAIERAFREDMEVWTAPSPDVMPPPPRRMYAGGYAGIGGRTWMEATSSSRGISPNDDDLRRSSSSSSPSSSPFLLDDVRLVDNSLRANGLTRHDLTPKAFACLLEQARRFALELLANAQDYAIHAARGGGGEDGIDVGDNDGGGTNGYRDRRLPRLLPADLLLAAESLEESGGGVNGVASTLPSVEQISELARSVNRVPLPPIPSNCYDGIVLPPQEMQLTARTFDVVEGARVVQRMVRGGGAPDDVVINSAEDSGGGSSSSTQAAAAGGRGAEGVGGGRGKRTLGSYGASRGRQIGVHMRGNRVIPPSSDAMDVEPSLIGEGAGEGGGGGETSAATKTSTGSGSGKSTSTTARIGTKKGQKRTLTEL
jgi:hypothetical protein